MLLLARIIHWLPISWALLLGRMLGWFWYYFIPIRRRVARQNIQRALGKSLSDKQRRHILRACYTHLALYAIETLRAPYLTAAISEERVERLGLEHLQNALGHGKGVIVVLAHIGNVDLIGLSQASLGFACHAIVREIAWGPAQRFVTAVRQRTGMHLIPPRRSKDRIKQALAQNALVGFVVDQHMPKHRAIVCEFFGQLASTSPAPARFAFETGATVLPAVIVRQGLSEHHQLRIGPPFVLETPHDDLQANIRHNTQRINHIIEDWIRQFPEQWLWLHKRWKVQDHPEGWDIPQELGHLA